MYIRIKKRENKKGVLQYAYLVNSKYRKTKTPKQKVKAYLGRCYPLDPIKSIKFEDLINKKDLVSYFKSKNPTTILTLFLKRELVQHGFIELDNLFRKRQFTVDIPRKKVISDKNNAVCLKLNEGFLSNHTIKQLFKFKSKGITKEEIGKDLIQRINLAGIKLEPEVFSAFFSSISSIDQSSTS